ncbi:hypothetical protein F2P56_024666 [Juglans regia]|uniref:Uncharacterized protein n=2 Tax=Juglans regia TaxID=51240 RepID=A0A833X2X0_JUGRE|nr:uncharacterized protein LOC108986103 [Juglans regia]KAF5455051.1 hypothetical protein F2P56_024666 [Juglans regia]
MTSSARKAHARRARYEEVFSAQRPSSNNRDPSGEYLIMFSEEDGEGLSRPHDDALVVTSQISNYRTKRVLIDNGSSADILFWEAFIKMEITPDRLRPAPTPLKGSTGDTIQPIGVITLFVLVGTTPKTTSFMINFLVVKAPSSYNMILGRPSLNQMSAITSTYHLKVKFSTSSRLGEMLGEQQTARDCYTQDMKSKVVVIQTLEQGHREAATPPPWARTKPDQEVRDEETLR